MIKESFENLTQVQKIQLYFLIPMIFWLLYFGIEKGFKNSNLKPVEKKDSVDIIQKDKMQKTTTNEIVRFIEEKVILYQLSLQTVYINDKLITLEMKGSLKAIFSFLQKLQSHLDIVSFKLENGDKLISFKVIINSEYFFNKKLIQKEFYTQSDKKKTKAIKIKIDAIVEDEVFINGQWYNKGKSYGEYEILKVDKTYIILKDKQSQKLIKVELVNESL